ncbi:MAG: 3-hydroxyacyl-ACP dehydratase FabZ family protein [Myxococcota bacterium]
MKPVEELIPHRAPFAFLDELLEVEGNRLRARRTIRADEPHFAGHYPKAPLMPGVLLCEAALQAGACLLSSRLPAGSAHGVPVVSKIEEARFKRPVRPGDQIEVEVEELEVVGPAHWMKGKITCNGKLVVSLRFTVMLAEMEAE